MEIPPQSPSIPSMKFIALMMPTIQSTVSGQEIQAGMDSAPRPGSQMEWKRKSKKQSATDTRTCTAKRSFADMFLKSSTSERTFTMSIPARSGR